jgi:diadenylate cyclase
LNAFDGLQTVWNFIRPIIDVGIMTFLLYKAYQIIVKTNAMQIIKAGIMVALFLCIRVPF